MSSPARRTSKVLEEAVIVGFTMAAWWLEKLKGAKAENYMGVKKRVHDFIKRVNAAKARWA